MKPSRILHRFFTFSFGIVNVGIKIRVSYLGDITFSDWKIPNCYVRN